jgi:DEAD/DEAH box helicase domain-containing protein
MAVPVERRDIGVAVDRHRSSRGPLREGARFIALYDQTYGSLRVSGKVLEDALLPDVLGAALELCKEDPAANCSGAACDVLAELARAIEIPAGPQWWSDAPQLTAGDGVRVIMPGSVGLQTLHGNREFYVEGVFMHSTGLRYRGHHEQTRHNVYELIPVSQLAPLQGESKLGSYNPETGELKADSGSDELEEAA